MTVEQDVWKFWKKRTAMSYSDFKELLDSQKGQAFALAGVENQALASELYQETLKVLRGELTTAEFVEKAQGILDAYGPGEALYGFTGTRKDSWYADMVIRTNVQHAVAAGRYSEMFAPEWMERAPLWQYQTVGDNRVRLEHRMLQGLVFRKDDLSSRRYLPPLGYNCRCMAVEIPEHETRGYISKVRPGDWPMRNFGVEPPDGWNTDRVTQLMGRMPKRSR